jgi:uncharacterized MnhB-related membrane protein
MTHKQLDYIVYTIILWSSIIIINTTSSLVALIWFGLSALFSLYKVIQLKDISDDENKKLKQIIQSSLT